MCPSLGGNKELQQSDLHYCWSFISIDGEHEDAISEFENAFKIGEVPI
jgi:hypothetical protein